MQVPGKWETLGQQNELRQPPVRGGLVALEQLHSSKLGRSKSTRGINPALFKRVKCPLLKLPKESIQSESRKTQMAVGQERVITPKKY